jgi:class 3 adenylate cyclase
MSVKNILEEIDLDVQDVLSTSFAYTSTQFVPSREDSGLSYERGKDKRGKEIETCVLFVDIRNSVALTDKHQHQTMGRVYTAFTKAVLKVARHHNGHIRNIIGDRVMIVFPVANCFKNAVDCAVSINHIASKIINKRFEVDFKCGIGIAHGNLRVIKVGIQRNGTENGENKGLVWVGKPANYASRITDMANKIVEQELIEVRYNPKNPRKLSGIYPSGGGIMGSLANLNLPEYLSTIEVGRLTKEEFVDRLSNFENGFFSFLGGRLIETKKIKVTKRFPSILMTESVMKGLKIQDPARNSLVKNLWKPINYNFKNMGESVFGADLIWII